jgi:hypothetical protein
MAPTTSVIFNRMGRTLSHNDVRVILTAQVIARLSHCPDLTDTVFS